MARLLINLLLHKFSVWKRFWQRLVIAISAIELHFLLIRSALYGMF